MTIFKKHAMALAALAIAATSATLMSFGKNEAKPRITDDEPALFWYDVDENGNIGMLHNQIPSVAQTKTESKFGGSKQITLCDDTAPQECLRGYSTPQIPGSSASAPLSSDHVINRN